MESQAKRGLGARDAAYAALNQELDRRYAALPAIVPEQLQTALKRVALSKARSAFITGGGTLAGFERIWERLWDAPRRDRAR